MQVAQRMTAEQFLELPHAPGRRVELIDGAVVVAEPTRRHQQPLLDLGYAIESWRRAGPGRGFVSLALDVEIDTRNVFAPDLLWYAEGRAPGPDQRPSPMPDIAAEVRSPSTWRYDIGAKKARYESLRLAELWLVDTSARVIMVFRRSAPDVPAFDVALELALGDVLSSPLLPGFELALAELLPTAP